MMTVYIVDDESHAVGILLEYVRLTPRLQLLGSSTNPVEALESIKTFRPQLTFLDINMPEISGLELTRVIGELTQIIFTTSYREYGPEAYESNVIDYLLKPISYQRFLKSVEKSELLHVKSSTQPIKEQHAIFVKGNIKGKLVPIPAWEIIYIKSDEHYIHIHTETNKVVTLSSIGKIQDQLPDDHFVRVHRSYIINTARIKSIEYGGIIMGDGLVIPLSRSYKEHFWKYIGSR